jgi:hypothetical protein
MPRVNDAVFVVPEAKEEEDIEADYVEIETSTTKFDPGEWAAVAPPPGTYFDAEQGLNNCALCTAAALVSENIDVPQQRQTAGFVNQDLQQKLSTLLGAKAMETLYQKVSAKDWLHGRSWREIQRDDAFIIYAQYDHRACALRDGQRVKQLKEEDQSLADQIIGLAVYVKKKLKTEVRYHGFPGKEEEAPSALGFMRGQPDGTKFAVCTLNGKDGAAHWIYAGKRNGNLVFKDFQLDRDGKPEPPASDHPLAPNGRVYKDGYYEGPYKGTRVHRYGYYEVPVGKRILMYVLAFGDTVVGGEKYKFHPMIGSYARGSFASVVS